MAWGHSVVPLSPSHVGGMGWQEAQGGRKVTALFAGSTGCDTWNWRGNHGQCGKKKTKEEMTWSCA